MQPQRPFFSFSAPISGGEEQSSPVNSFYYSGSDPESCPSASAPIKVRTNFFKQRVCRSLKRKATLGERVPCTTGNVPSGPRSQRREGLLCRIRSELHANFGLPLRGYGPRPLSRYPGIAGITYSPAQAEQIEAQARLLADLSLARGVTQHSQLPPAVPGPSINIAHSDLIVTSSSFSIVPPPLAMSGPQAIQSSFGRLLRIARRTAACAWWFEHAPAWPTPPSSKAQPQPTSSPEQSSEPSAHTSIQSKSMTTSAPTQRSRRRRRPHLASARTSVAGAFIWRGGRRTPQGTAHLFSPMPTGGTNTNQVAVLSSVPLSRPTVIAGFATPMALPAGQSRAARTTQQRLIIPVQSARDVAQAAIKAQGVSHAVHTSGCCRLRAGSSADTPKTPWTVLRSPPEWPNHSRGWTESHPRIQLSSKSWMELTAIVRSQVSTCPLKRSAKSTKPNKGSIASLPNPNDQWPPPLPIFHGVGGNCNDAPGGLGDRDGIGT